MAKNISPPTPPEAVISIIGSGMRLEGSTETDGSVRIEGAVRGNVRAGKSVVVGKDGVVDGSIYTQDAVIAGRVSGGIHAESRLELQATSVVDGEVEAPRMQVDEGAQLQGRVVVGEAAMKAASQASHPQLAGGGGKSDGSDGAKSGGSQSGGSQSSGSPSESHELEGAGKQRREG